MSSPPKTKRIGRGRPRKNPNTRPELERTEAAWSREALVRKIAAWEWRLAPYARGQIQDQCGACQMNGRCNRIPLNPEITAKALQRKQCPDQKSMWKQILDKEAKPYDWGF